MSIVNTNFNSITTLFQIRRSSADISSTMEKLSTGLRINKLSDDPSGKASTIYYEAQIKGIRQATVNAEEARLAVETASLAAADTQELLIRMRDLALRTMNSATVTDSDVTLYQQEFEDLRDAIRDKYYNLTFNGINMFSQIGKTVQIGPNTGPGNEMTLGIDNALKTQLSGDLLGLYMVKLSGDALNSAAGRAASAMVAISSASYTGSLVQTTLGAQETRLDSAIEDLSSQELYNAAAKSNIMDADLASEITHFAKLQIISQAGTAMLAQANNIDQRLVNILDEL